LKGIQIYIRVTLKKPTLNIVFSESALARYLLIASSSKAGENTYSGRDRDKKNGMLVFSD
jgi:hypothetical protein